MSDKFIIQYKGILLSITLSDTNIHIKDSYRIIDPHSIVTILNKIATVATTKGYSYKRSIKSWTNEWKAHNYLYMKNFKTESTCSTDLSEKENIFRKFGYWFISKFLY